MAFLAYILNPKMHNAQLKSNSKARHGFGTSNAQNISSGSSSFSLFPSITVTKRASILAKPKWMCFLIQFQPATKATYHNAEINTVIASGKKLKILKKVVFT